MVERRKHMNAKENPSSAQQFVGKEVLLQQLFPNDADRPTTRWLDTQCAKRAIPFIRVGRLIWFDLAEVRAAMAAKTVLARASRRTPTGGAS